MSSLRECSRSGGGYHTPAGDASAQGPWDVRQKKVQSQELSAERVRICQMRYDRWRSQRNSRRRRVPSRASGRTRYFMILGLTSLLAVRVTSGWRDKEQRI